MTPHIAICGDLSGREARRGTHASRPVRQRQPQPEFISTGRISAIFVAGAFSRVRGRLGIGMPRGVRGPENHGQPVPINFSRPMKATGGPIPFGNARFQACKQSSRCFANGLQVQNSLSNASASYVQLAIGAFGNVRKAFGEIRNVQC